MSGTHLSCIPDAPCMHYGCVLHAFWTRLTSGKKAWKLIKSCCSFLLLHGHVLYAFSCILHAFRIRVDITLELSCIDQPLNSIKYLTLYYIAITANGWICFIAKSSIKPYLCFSLYCIILYQTANNIILDQPRCCCCF